MEHTLSRRGARLIANPPVAPYILEHFTRSGQGWDPEKRPDGYVALCIAENRLMWDVLVPRLSAYRNVPQRVLGYDAMIGSFDFRQKLASFMGRAFLGRTVEANQLVAVAGAGAVLELLFHCIADDGDGVLVPTPSYAGFWADLETRNRLNIVPVHGTSVDGFRVTTNALERALSSANHPIKALLFTTPNNPLGCAYTREELLEVLTWAERKGIHVVFDEIYALSVFGERPFVSVASVRPSLGPWAHVVWAFSKDFGASGLRCGVLLSENESVLRAIDGLAYWAACSGDTQYLLGELIADEEFVDAYIVQMRQRLARTYGQVVATLDAHGIAHIPAEAGIFLMCDLRSFLDEPTWDAEDRLWRRMVEEANVNLTPGSACRAIEPGLFRLCYASEPTEAVMVAVDRLGRMLGAGGSGPTR